MPFAWQPDDRPGNTGCSKHTAAARLADRDCNRRDSRFGFLVGDRVAAEPNCGEFGAEGLDGAERFRADIVALLAQPSRNAMVQASSSVSVESQALPLAVA